MITNISGLVRRAIEDYNMIEEGDRIAVALSGGKDSSTLLYELKNLQRFFNKRFELIAISINPGFEKFDKNLIKEMCEKVDVRYVIFDSKIKQVVFDERKEKNPCSLCANLRRGMLNSIAHDNNCNKIALGHNEDDVLETFLMNMIYAGNLSTLQPKAYMDKSEITLIRPLIYCSEKILRAYVRKNNIQIMNTVCPQDGITTRQKALDLLNQLENGNKYSKANIIGAIKRKNISGWKE